MRVEGERIGESTSGARVGVDGVVVGVVVVVVAGGSPEEWIRFRHGRRPSVDGRGASADFRFGRTVPLRMRHGHGGGSGSGRVALELVEGCGWILVDGS